MNLTIKLDRIEATNVHPDDVIVITLPALSTQEQSQQVKAKFTEAFPDNRVLVKTSNIGFDIFRSDGEQVA